MLHVWPLLVAPLATFAIIANAVAESNQYHGPLDEDVTLRERRRVKVTAALPEVLRDLDEDVLYLFHA